MIGDKESRRRVNKQGGNKLTLEAEKKKNGRTKKVT